MDVCIHGRATIEKDTNRGHAATEPKHTHHRTSPELRGSVTPKPARKDTKPNGDPVCTHLIMSPYRHKEDGGLFEGTLRGTGKNIEWYAI